MVQHRNLRRVLVWLGLALITLSPLAVNSATAQDFTIIALPDTQNYSQYYPSIYSAQTQWIVDNKDASNIVYVAHEGDIVNTGSSTTEWNNADAAMNLLDDPLTTGLPDGIPYGVVPGNHDEGSLYNQYFGVDRFCTTYPSDCRSYYGDGYPSGFNDSNYTLFSAGGMDFIAVNLDYSSPAAGLLDWADQLLKDNSARRAIVVSHYLINADGTFGPWGQQVYDALKDNPNLFLMLCGHVHAEARRTDIYNGSTVHTLLADFQDYPNGGNGFLRVLEFSPENDEIRVSTYSPSLDQYETDADSQFTLAYDMEAPASGFTAYNDCVYDSGTNGYIGANVTTYGIGNNFSGSTTGELLDQATGNPTGVIATLTQSGGVVWQPSTSSGGADTAAGTDANNTFGGIADMTGVIYYGSSGWYVDLTFTGLDPAKTYTFATSASRNGSTYTLRNTRYTISSVAATNASTAGVNVINESSVWFNTGDNHNEGYVARWTNIQPESDGSFTVRAEANDPATEYRSYAFDVFMLQEEGGIPPVMVDVPDVSGMTQADAESEIIAAGLTVGTVTTAYSSTIDAGHVISQDPAALTSVPEGSSVDLEISLGPAPPVVGVCEDFESGFAGANVGDHADWFDGGSGPVATAGNGVAGSVGLAPASAIFTWIAHPFDWNAADFVGVNFQMDFQTNGSGQFDDDRIGWMITDSSTGSNNIFGVQLDPGGGGQNIEAYWDGNTFGDDGGRTSIVDLPVLPGNAWYRLRAEITKLTDTSARIDVTLTELDALGNVGSVVASGTLDDTALLPNTTGNEIPNPAYFTGPIWPAFKNHSGTQGYADNACYEVVTSSGSMVEVPDVVNLPQAAAETVITDALLTVGTVSTANSDSVPAGDVISQDPAAYTSVPSGSAVDIVVSLGPEPAGAGEGFDSYTPGSNIGSYDGWFDGGSGPVVTDGIGVAGSVGLAPSGSIFTWTAYPFDWNDPDLMGVVVGMDFQTDGSGHFDDDRVGWMIRDDTNSSDYIFGVQMDPGGSGPSGYNIEAYWDGDTFGDDGGRTSIADLPVLTGNAWYRLRAEITKLSATSARIDVTLTELDASGNPGAVVASGFIADTDLLPDTAQNEIPNPAYFSGPMWPAYKNHTAVDGAVDNAYFEVISKETFAFVVVTDLHTSDAWPNTTVADNLQQIRNWIDNPTSAMPAPSFMVITGDFPHLWQTEESIDNVLGADFLWYPVIGNHEVSDDINNFYEIRDTKVPSLPHIVDYGPAGSMNTSYSWEYGNAHFVAVNEYWDGTTNSGADHAADGDIRPELLNWINSDLYETPGSDRPEFVFVHEPAYPDHRHVGDSLDQHPANRDAFVSMLNDNQVEALFCGHTHYYEHDVAPEYPLGDLHQITNGYLRAYDGPTITYVLVDGDTTTFRVYRRASESVPFTLFEEWTIGNEPAPEPVTVSFQEGTNGYAGSADAHIMEAEPTASHGALDSVEWDNDDPSGTGQYKYALIRFDDIFGADAGQIPAGATIQSATLTYNVFNTGDPASVYEVSIDWTESVTYNDFGGDPGVQTDEYGTALGSAVGASAAAQVMDVTASISAWVNNPSANKGWIFLPTGTDGVDFRSSEYATAADRPILSVRFLPPTGPPVVVPDVVDTTQADAEAAILSADLVVGAVTTAYSNTVAEGNVISQDPAAGIEVPAGSAVNLVVSLGVEPPPVAVPYVLDLLQTEAELSIEGAGLVVGTVSTSHHDTVLKDHVISQDPAADELVPAGSAVDLVVSLGEPPPGVQEGFDALAPGSTIGSYPEWYDGGGGPVVTAGNGVGGSVGLAPANNIFTWTAHPFDWNDPNILGVTLGMDFQTDGSGQFDDDRLGWMIAANSVDSADIFGVQLDHSDGGIVTYWRQGSTRIQDQIVPLSGTQPNTWYRFRAVITKLALPTEARIEVSLVELDGDGAPVGTPYSGIVENTSLWSGGVPDDRYFTVPTMWPAFKNYTAAAAPADNAYFAILYGTPPVMVTVPLVEGLLQSAAEAAIIAENLVVGTVTTAYHDTVALDHVISQSPAAGVSVPEGSAVDLMVSLGPAPVPPGAVGYWSFDDGTGSDGSGSGNDATIFGAVPTAGYVGDGLDFNGAGNHLQVADSPTLDFADNQMTLACWIYPTNLSSGWVTLMHRTRANVSWYDWQLYVRAVDAPTANRPVFRIDWDGDNSVDANEQVQGDIVLSTNTWYHIAATYDGSQMKFYIDGSLRGTTSVAGTIPNGGRDIWIGGNEPWGEYFDGVIDEVFIYDRALSEGEIQSLMNPAPPVPVAVPAVEGELQADAEALIIAEGLVVGTVTTAYSDTVALDHVISQDPVAGTEVAPGSAVDLVVSLGPEPPPLTVPPVEGLLQSAAEANIVSAGLVVGTVTTAYSDTVALDHVISQDPVAGTAVAPGSAVDLVVSLGPEPPPLTVPPVEGLLQSAAEADIVAAGLVVGTVTTAYSDTVALDHVISQDPVGGTEVAAGTAVDLVVSLGPEPLPVTVPLVEGLLQSAAEADIVAAGLVVGTVTTAYHDTVALDHVISQNPVAGTEVASGSAVDLVVSLGPEPPPLTVPPVEGLLQSAAEADIVAAGLVVGAVTTAYHDTVALDHVISQDPVAGTEVAPGSAVDLVVSLGPEPPPLTVPPVEGLLQSAAEADIVAAGLVVGTVTTAYSDTVALDHVISQSPAAGVSVPEGSAVDLMVSLGPAPMPPGAVGYWSFDDGTGSDGSGSGNDATIFGAVPTAGYVGDGLDFNGAGNHLQVADSPTLDFADNQMTLACWIYPTNLSSGWVTLMHRTRANVSWYDWQLYARAGDAPTANRPVFRIDWDGDRVVDANEQVQGDIVLSTNTWYHIAATYDGSQMKFYIDGTLRGTTSVVGTIPNGGRDIWIGGNEPWGEYFDGVIDEVFIYDRALSEGEIQSLMNPAPPVPVAVPAVEGELQADAEALIVAEGLVVGTVTTAYSDMVALDHVISQDPVAGTEVASGSAVDLVVSLGPEPPPLTVPPVEGLLQSAAEADIVAAGLVVGTVTTAYSDTVALDHVISQDPVAGTEVAPGSAVDLVVSLGPEPPPLTVPPVEGLLQSAAEADIVAAGLVVGTVTTAYSDTVAAGYVISQDPVAGTEVAPGSAVDLVVSLGLEPLPVTVPLVEGLLQSVAEADIVAAGLVVGTVTTAYSDTVALDHVISQSPAAGVSVPEGSAVDLMVSLGPAPVPPGAVGYWSFDDGTGADGSSYGNDATIFGAVPTAGYVGDGLDFNGAGNHLQVADSPTLDFADNQMTLACWIYPTNLSSGWVTIMHRTRANVSWYDWQLYARAGDAPTANRPVFRIDWDGDRVVDANEQVQGDIVLSTNTWYHIAATYDGSQMKFYIDGTLRGTTNVVGAIPNGGRDIWIGGNEPWGEFFDGVIDEVFIYERALSEGEIQSLMNPAPPVPVAVPAVEGELQADAEAAIIAAGLVVGTVTTAYHDTVALDHVISQDPVAGTEVAPGSAVDLVVSLGPEPPPAGVEGFNTGYTIDQTIGIHDDWFDDGAGPVVTNGIGVGGSVGLAPANNIFTWTAKPFDWNDPDFQAVKLRMDFETDGSGRFDDDRLGWMITNSDVSSANIFGVQLDHADGGIVTYWREGATRIQDLIVPLSDLSPNTWYRFSAEITKLTAASARIDVSLEELDAEGNPTGISFSGTVDDTDLWPGGVPNVDYFNAATMWPAFKNYSALDGAADNAYAEVIYKAQAFAFVVVTDLHTSDSYPNLTVESNLQQVRDWIDNPTPDMPAPAFMVISGDFPHLWQTEATIDNIIGPDFLWYPVIGNHEVSDDINNFYEIRDTKVPSLPHIVNNGPAGSVNTSYSWDYENAHFVAINAYWDGTTNTGADRATDGDIRPELRDWINADLIASEGSGGDMPEFVFVHEPAYPAIRHVGDSLDAYPANRDAFVTMLNDNEVEAMFCGHTHYYEHDVSTEFPLLGNVHQVTNDYLRAYDHTSITYVLVDGNSTTFRVYRRTSSSVPFTLFEEWTIGSGPVVEAPAPPSDLVATAVSSSAITLSWTDNADNESGFEIEWSAEEGGTFSPLNIVPANSDTYSDTALDPLTQYCYRVRAVNSVGESAFTDVACATTEEEVTGAGVTEDFDVGFTIGQAVGTHPDWFDGGSGPVVTAGNGVAGTTGLAQANPIFTWTAQPFDWNALDFIGINIQMDFQTDGSAHFDDDRVGWMIRNDTNNSNYIFGVQLDPGGSTGYNIEAYWDGDTLGDDGGRTSIADLPTLSANSWYSLRAEITKLTATSARIDVTLTALDADGNPGTVVASGSIPDTDLLPNTANNEIPNPAYFTGPLWPAFKNYNAIAGAADNAYMEIVR